jgi:beta-galactosidase
MDAFMHMPLPDAVSHLSCTLVILVAAALTGCAGTPSDTRKTDLFTKGWHFHLGDVPSGETEGCDDSQWRLLDLPHDWSIEGSFSKDHPATPGGGALPGGIGWYRKAFTVPASDTSKLLFVDFDGVYRNSDVWINGHHLGQRPYGYSSFRYELTPFLKPSPEKNVLAVKVDNSQQPNSRWYSGSGIYRNVWLVTTDRIRVDHWGTYVTTPEVTESFAKVAIRTEVRNSTSKDQTVTVRTTVVDHAGKSVAEVKTVQTAPMGGTTEVAQQLSVSTPALWSIETPTMYKAVTAIECEGRICDTYETPFGIRTFQFDAAKGFSLNGKPTKIKGVCNHHDLGCLGAAVNRRALERQLEIMRSMGVNSIRTSHNPPAPELLDLCDRMGFIVMDEAFDMWKMKKTDFDYAQTWDAWHARDLEDMIMRDRNHPSVMIWSIGNEIVEQWEKNDSLGMTIARELSGIVKRLDTTRPITSACNHADASNPLVRSGALDLVGYNYSHKKYPDFPKASPGKLFIGSETTSALATRGHYDMPSDSIRRWPDQFDKPFALGNADFTCSSYDNCSAPWGSTHEETWKIIKKHDFLSGMYVWTGFDYLGEPTPYSWPARSSYFGIMDLAGFPKDAFYLYQSEWTNTSVLHIFPHWNWKPGDVVDVWVYTNCSEVELFLNGVSLGPKRKVGDDLHLMWRTPYAPGTLKAVGRTTGKDDMIREVRTAGAPARIALEADRSRIAADGTDLSFITVRVLDVNGTIVPDADNLIQFTLAGEGRLAGVDNGLQTSDESFKASSRKAFSGLCLAVIQSTETAGRVSIEATSAGLEGATITIDTRASK